MGLFDKLTELFAPEKQVQSGSGKQSSSVQKQRPDISQYRNLQADLKPAEMSEQADGQAGSEEPLPEAIVAAPTSHMVEDWLYGDGDSRYRISFQVNDSFRDAKSHAGEIEMLSTYAPDAEYGEEGSLPCLAIQIDDAVFCAVEEFKERGTFEGAIELEPLSGTFLFKAKMEYYGDMMYFYGLDRCDGFWDNNGLCMVYPRAYAGTENEKVLMDILDQAAEANDSAAFLVIIKSDFVQKQ